MVIPIRCITLSSCDHPPIRTDHVHSFRWGLVEVADEKFPHGGGRSPRPSVQRMKWRLVVEVGAVSANGKSAVVQMSGVIPS